jgi:WD40 repeat protein
MTLLQNQVLGVENEHLLHEIHMGDENHLQQDLYTQM